MYQVVEFKTDGKFYIDDVLDGTWSQSGSTVTIVSNGETNTATISGNVLTVSITETDGADTIEMEMQFTKM